MKARIEFDESRILIAVQRGNITVLRRAEPMSAKPLETGLPKVPTLPLPAHRRTPVRDDAFCWFRAALCCNSAWNHIFLSFRNVLPRLYRRPDYNLVVSRINSPQLRLTLLIKSAFLFKVHLVIWNSSCILHFEQFCVHLDFC